MKANLTSLAFWKKYIAIVIFLVLLIFNSIYTKNFLSSVNFINFIKADARICLVSLGMTLVIATGGIDISVGSAMALGAIICATGINEGSPLVIIVSILVVVAFGIFNGTVISKLAILPMVVTLATRYIMRGMAKGITGAANVTYSAPSMTSFFTVPLIGKIPVHFFIMLLAIFVTWVLVNKMKLGSQIEAYGNNPTAARNCGINTGLVITLCYAILALYSWIAGFLEMAVVSSAHPATIGVDMEIDAIAATLIGGTPIDGGYPNVIGTVFGTFVLEIITMMCNMLNISYSISLMIKASIIIAALFFHAIGKDSK